MPPPQATPATVSALPSAAVQIAAMSDSSYAMLVDGSVWAWGQNEYGELGDGQACGNYRCLSPVRIEGYGADTAMRLPPGGARAVTMFVVAADGTAMGSGRNNYGQMGNGESSSRTCSEANQYGHCITSTAGAIPELGGSPLQVARGYYHTLVLNSE